MTDVLQDVRYGLRMLGKSPALSTVAIVTLALGIGANAAILLISHSLLLRQFPYSHPDRLVVLWGKDVKRGRNETQVSLPDVLEWQRRATSFESITAVTWTDYQSFSWNSDNGSERIKGIAVLPNLFETIEKQPLLGRSFLPEEFAGNKRVVLLSYPFWHSHFGSDTSVVGRTVRINREPYTVVGVLPPGFEVPVLDDAPQILVPLALDSADALNPKERILVGAGRLKPGRTLNMASAEMQAIGDALATARPENAGTSVNASSLSDSDGLQDARTQLPMFLATVLLMMLIAAANVAGILLSRFAARQPELVVRTALGASRGRLMRQLITESLILALLAGILAAVLCQWVMRLVISFKPFYMPHEIDVHFGSATVITTLALALIVGLAFGFVPALTIARSNLQELLNRASTRLGLGWRQSGLRNGLVVVQVGLSMALLIGASLMVKTVMSIARVNIGFDPSGLAMGRMNLDAHRYPSATTQTRFYESLVERLAAQPGVQAATAASHLSDFDPGGSDMGSLFRFPGREQELGNGGPHATVTAVMPGFFSAMRMPLLRGRPFAESEGEPVIIVDQTFVDMYLGKEDPIGIQVTLLQHPMRSDEEVMPGVRTIVGVVPAVRRIAYWTKPYPHTFVPFSQNPVPSMYAITRTADGSGAAVIRKMVGDLDPDVPVYWSATMQNWIDHFYASQRFELIVLSAFGLIALLIAATGLYALITQRVILRTRELGIRIALGANRRDVQWVVLRQAGGLIAGGVAAGLTAAAILVELLSKFLFGVRQHDPATFVAAAVAVTAIGLMAAFVPARRAANIEPLIALRCE